MNTNITYYLYRLTNSILFDKCGATIEWENRCRKNRQEHGSQSIITLLETIEGPNTPEMWQVIGDREWELADEYGYPKGTHYRLAREKLIAMNARGAAAGGRKAGPNNGQNLKNSGKLLEFALKGGKVQRTTTFEIAEEIRSKYVPRKYTIGMLMKEYNLSRGTIAKILHNETYKQA